MNKLACVISLHLLLCAGVVSAQSTHCQIMFHSGEETSLCTLDSLNTDEMILYVTSRENSFSFPIDSITILVRFGERNTGEGAALGTLAGTAFGVFFGYQQYNNESHDCFLCMDPGPGIHMLTWGAVGGAAGLFFGTLAGSASRDKEIYDLGQRKKEEKIQIIQWLVLMKQ